MLRASAPRLILLAALGGALGVACARKEPPGAEVGAEPLRSVVGAPVVDAGESNAPASSRVELGSRADNLPFAATGQKLASIAWRTWIYTDTGPERTRYGYLRAGAVVDARGPAIVNSGCAGGWYRINPRGFVCVGKGASLTLDDPVAQQAAVRAVRGRGLPYLYALSDSPPPHLYFRLPSRKEMLEVEGERVFDRAASFRRNAESNGIRATFGEPSEPPAFLADGGKLIKPYGVKQTLQYAAHGGVANSGSGFALQKIFVWEGREFGLTTEHDLVALDRTRPVVPSELAGVVLEEGEDLPVAFIDAPYATLWAETASGNLAPKADVKHRQGFKLTGKKRPGGMWQTRDGDWVVGSASRIVEPRTEFPSFATGDRKWVDVSIGDQTLVAYVGRRAVFATLVSTGRGGMGDPERDLATVRGTFMIYDKSVSATMDGDEDRADSYSLLDVPFVQYFHKGFALHGTYWHDEFGRQRSHGCVNLSPRDSAWLFEWTDPPVPEGWHGVVNKDRGTVVYVHG
jgi:hypothetical protein